MTQPADTRQVPPHALPDDRFDGTDSGGSGTDTAYPPVDPDSAPSSPDDERAVPDDRTPGTSAGVPGTTGPGSRAATGTDYETDGPDELADEPQR
ncbi:MAG: hypothetical protein LH650_13735 [Chloroflexi bacterium]|nr:hypothetical protein [Chloroflexota bacterium]